MPLLAALVTCAAGADFQNLVDVLEGKLLDAAARPGDVVAVAALAGVLNIGFIEGRVGQGTVTLGREDDRLGFRE